MEGNCVEWVAERNNSSYPIVCRGGDLDNSQKWDSASNRVGVYNGGAYACTCGSGKKYKNCCGKNA